jgi:archaetidylinositol phosphate synthase
MVLDSARGFGDRLLGPLADRLAPGGADRLTWASLAAAGGAGISFTYATRDHPNFLILGSLLVLLNALLDALDGMVARRNKSASPAGDFLDHSIDRYCDFFIIGGLAASSFGDYRWGFFAITGVLLTSYIATQAAAVGLRRDYGGLLGRADRLALLVAVPIVQAAFVLANLDYTWNIELPWRGTTGPPEVVNPIIALLMLFAILGHITALQRFIRARRALVLAQSGARLDEPPKN